MWQEDRAPDAPGRLESLASWSRPSPSSIAWPAFEHVGLIMDNA